MKNNREELIQAIHDNLGIIKHKFFRGGFDVSKHFNITGTQWRLVHLISHSDGLSVSEIANHFGITNSAATQMIDALVEKGLLAKKSGEGDRRFLKIKISKKCKDHFKAIRKKVFSHLANIFDSLNEKELEQFCALSKKIAKESRK